jgi:hypothetical protein
MEQRAVFLMLTSSNGTFPSVSLYLFLFKLLVFDFESAEGGRFFMSSSHHDLLPSDYCGMSDYSDKWALCFALPLIGSYTICGLFLMHFLFHHTTALQVPSILVSC